MKKYAIILCVLLFKLSYGQSINTLPKDENGKVHFTSIISSSELSQEETYNKTKLFFINNFNSSKDVIQLDDQKNGTIIGKGNVPIEIQSGKYKFPISMSFTIKIESKDNRCKMDIYNIVYNNESPAEMFFNESADDKYQKLNAKAKLIMENYRDQTIDKVAFIESKIKEEFSKKEKNW